MVLTSETLKKGTDTQFRICTILFGQKQLNCRDPSVRTFFPSIDQQFIFSSQTFGGSPSWDFINYEPNCLLFFVYLRKRLFSHP